MRCNRYEFAGSIYFVGSFAAHLISQLSLTASPRGEAFFCALRADVGIGPYEHNVKWARNDPRPSFYHVLMISRICSS